MIGERKKSDTVEEKKEETKYKRKPRKSIDPTLFDDENMSDHTVQQTTQKKDEDEDTIDCG